LRASGRSPTPRPRSTRRSTDGGTREAGESRTGSVYDTADGLPPGMPDFVKEALDEGTKAAIRRGERGRPE
jgi:hypothetical protein